MIIATGNLLRNLTAKGDNKDLIVLNDEQIKELQKRVLSMADDIVNICEENNLNYHLTGGSALGAVRHNGFIPWDDDFDIDIERKDFDKLLDLIKSKYGEKYYITCPKSKEGVQTLAAHVRLNNTVVRSCNDPTNEHCGVTIDIVIIENTFNNQIKALNYTEKYIENWKNYFENKDFNGMEKEYKKIKTEMNYLAPIEKMINEARTIENLHKLIKNNGQDFNLTKEQMELAEKLQ